MWNSYKQEILTIVDKIAPLEEVENTIRSKVSKIMKSKLNRRSRLLKKQKHHIQTENEKKELKLKLSSLDITIMKKEERM